MPADALRVLHLTTSYPRTREDFSAVFVHWANAALSRRGVSVTVLAPSAPGLPGREELDGVSIRRFPYFFPRRLERLAYGDGMPTNLRRSRLARLQVLPFAASLFLHAARLARNADILHCHWAQSALVGLAVKRLTGKPLVLTVWGSDIRTLRPALLRRIARGCDRIVSPALETHVNLRRAGVTEFAYIPAMIDPERFRPGVDAQDIRQKLGLKDEKVVLFVGRLYPEKDPETFVRALPALLARRRDVRFVVVGDGVLRPILESLRRELGLEGHLDLVGASHEVNKYLTLADCFVACSNPITNVWSGTIAEAMTMGVPALVTRSTPVDEEFFSDGVDCLLVRPGDPADLAGKIDTVLGDEGLANRLRRGGRELLEREGRTPERVVEGLLGLYRGLR